jgi:hypothetical protein
MIVDRTTAHLKRSSPGGGSPGRSCSLEASESSNSSRADEDLLHDTQALAGSSTLAVAPTSAGFPATPMSSVAFA